MKPRSVLLDLTPLIPLVAIPALLRRRTGSGGMGWSFPGPVKWLAAILGTTLWLAGAALMIWTIRLFWKQGKGTLAPFDPTRRLVAVGPYQHVRNPMYTGVFLVLSGETILLGSPAILVYALLFCALPFVYVPLVEEPGLEQRFGAGYRTYKANVPRWIPQLTPWTGSEA